MKKKPGRAASVASADVPAPTALRRQAEAKIQADEALTPDVLSPEATRHVLHELRVHQIELEAQNDELRRTQAELEASRARYFDLYDLAPVAYFTLSEAGLILQANLAAGDLLGVPRSTLANQSISRLILPADQDIYYRHRKQLLSTGTAQVCEVRMRRADATPCWVRMEATVAPDADGVPLYRAVVNDITERKQFDDVQSFLLQPAYLHSGVGFFAALARYLAETLRLDGVRIDRLQDDARTARTVALYFDGTFQDNVEYALQGTPCAHVVGKGTCCFPAKVRHLFPMDAVLQTMEAESYVGTPLWSHDGQPIGLIALIGCQPLANPRPAEAALKLVAMRAAGELERQQAEAGREAAHQRTLTILESIGDGFVTLDRKWRVGYINARGAQIIGTSPADLLGQSLWESFPDTLGSPFHKACERALAEQVSTCAETFFAPQNTWFEARAYPSPEGLSVFFQDTTVRKRADEFLARAAEELTRSNQDLEQFAHVASHDLQEPLRMITGFLGLLKSRYDGKLDAKADEYIGFATDAAVRMRRLIADLFAYSRVGRTTTPAASAAADAVDTALANLQASIADTGARITRDPLPTIQADPMELTQLFQNLIANALKFRRDGVAPDVHISARRLGADEVAGARAQGSGGNRQTPVPGVSGASGDQDLPAAPSASEPRPLTHGTSFWLFAVRDNGIGIAPQDHGRLFAIFQRLHTREEYPGTGIGLAICKKIVERHGGRIWVESEAGQGATFCFTLPDAGSGRGRARPGRNRPRV